MQHKWDFGTEFCTGCGASMISVQDNVRPVACQASPNIVAVSHIIARRSIRNLVRMIYSEQAY